MKRYAVRRAVWCAAIVLGCATGCFSHKQQDKGLFENRKAQELLQTAKDDAAVAKYDLALKGLEEADVHADLAIKLTTSRSIADLAKSTKLDIANLRAQVLAVKMQVEVEKAQKEVKQEGMGTAAKAGDDFWKRGGTQAAEAGQAPGGKATDISAEDAQAREAKLGTQRKSANVDDVTEAEFAKKPAAKPVAGDQPIDTTVGTASGEPIVVSKIERKNKAVIVYVTFNNKGTSSVVGSATGSLRDENGNEMGRSYVGYLQSGFQPNWENINDSKGTEIAAGEVSAPSGGRLNFVLVADVADPSRVKSAVVTLVLQNENQYSGKGP